MPQPTTWALELGTLDREHPSFSGGNEAMMLCKDGTGGTWKQGWKVVSGMSSSYAR